MPQLKIMRGSEQVTIDTDQDMLTTDILVINILTALRALRAGIVDIYDIDITRLDVGGVFSYCVKTDGVPPSRNFEQTWYFDVPVTVFEFGTVTGKWSSAEFILNIGLRDAIRTAHETAGLSKLTCKW